ncbi:cation transporter [Paenibacillus cisolokensis]|nr:cation transporter [Paenibacillus sp. 32O-W]
MAMIETLKVKGMTCGHCVSSIEGALKQNGVTAKADLASGSVKVDYDATKISREKIRTIIEDQGYDVV